LFAEPGEDTRQLVRRYLLTQCIWQDKPFSRFTDKGIDSPKLIQKLIVEPFASVLIHRGIAHRTQACAQTDV